MNLNNVQKIILSILFPKIIKNCDLSHDRSQLTRSLNSPNINNIHSVLFQKYSIQNQQRLCPIQSSIRTSNRSFTFKNSTPHIKHIFVSQTGFHTDLISEVVFLTVRLCYYTRQNGFHDNTTMKYFHTVLCRCRFLLSTDLTS